MMMVSCGFSNYRARLALHLGLTVDYSVEGAGTWALVSHSITNRLNPRPELWNRREGQR
jgi:hypothetical protein